MKRISHIQTAVALAALAPGVAAAQEGVGAPAAAPAQAPAVAKPLGLTQDAWNPVLRRRGESKTNPGYVRYIYNSANVFPIRTRESMITTIKVPEDEKITQAFSGDDQGFAVGIPTPNTIAVKALFPGVDTNLVAFSETGRVYTFYVRSEGYNSKTISDFLVDVILPGPGAVEGSQMSASDMSPDAIARKDAQYPARTAERVRDPYGSTPWTNVPEKYRDYAEQTDFDPSTIVEDLAVYVPKGSSGGTIPYRVFHDDRFTYVDYGPNASQMTEWPVPSIVIQGVEGPVGFRTGGPGGRMLVMEALGSFVLRNGQRVIVIKKRSDVPANDKTLIEYPVASRTPMRIPDDLPPGRSGPMVSNARTVVPQSDKPATANGEPPSKVAPLPQERQVAGRQRNEKPRPSAGKGVAVVQEIPAPPPAAPVRTVVAVQANGTGASVPPINATPLAPTTNAAPLSGYRVVVGKGTAEQIDDRWKSYRVQYYEALNGKRMEVLRNEDGTVSMTIVPISTVAEGMRICAAIAGDGSPCTVKPAR